MATADPLAEPEREFLLGLLELLDRYRQRAGSRASRSLVPAESEREGPTALAVDVSTR
jgi:hypothetical protein